MKKLYEINYEAKLELFSEKDKITAQKRKLFWVFIALGGLILFLWYPLSVIFDINSKWNFLIALGGLAVVVIGIWFNKIFVFPSKPEKLNLIKGKQIFGEEEMTFNPKVDDSSAKYSDYKELFETENAFYLYTDKKKAQIVYKGGFVLGNADSFGEFIEKKTEKKIKPFSFKKQTVIAVIRTAVASVLTAVTILGFTLYANGEKGNEKVFSTDRISITATKEYEVAEVGGFELYLETNNIERPVTATYYSNEELKDEYQTSFSTVDQFITWWFTDVVHTKLDVKSVSENETRIEYEIDIIQKSRYYYYSSAIKTEDGFWFVECLVPTEYKDEYRDFFIKCVDSVEIK